MAIDFYSFFKRYRARVMILVLFVLAIYIGALSWLVLYHGGNLREWERIHDGKSYEELAAPGLR